jgi:serine/threonine-protein kinase
MADEADLSFGKIAIKKGFISAKQLEDAADILRAVRKLGLKEDIGTVLVKKKFMTAEQAKEVRQFQGQRSGVEIGGYQILEKIGQGGMGVVFKARQISLDRIVALKILNPKLAADSAYTERFLREARAVAKLSHPNIIVGIDVGKHGKYFYFAMEYVDGRTGLEVLRDEERFKEKNVLKIAMQMAKALDHAHKNGLVHRDIKPDNIMVTAKGEAKLCDLGLAKRLDLGDNLQPGTAVGTPHYIAPEQARGREDVDIRADIYALGASLYHMTTGRTLFHGETAASIMTHHLSSEAPNAKKVRPELSEQFCRLLERMLAKNPEDRYQTPADMQQDIERLIAGKPIKGILKADVPCSMERTARRARAAGQFSSRGTTGPRTPVGPPDPTTGPRKPVAARPTGMILLGAGVGILVLVIAALVIFKSPNGAPAGGPNKNNTAQAPNTTKGTPKVPKKKAPPTKTKLTWKPLEDARKARKANPNQFLRLVSLYQQAERGAPAALLKDIRRERHEVETQLNGAIERRLDAQWDKAYTLMTAQDYTGAMACFDDDQLPLDIRCESALLHWKKKRVDLEQQIYLQFRNRIEPELTQEMKRAEGDVAQLEALRPKLQAAAQKIPLESVKHQVARLEEDLDALIKRTEAAKRRAQFESFRVALAEAKEMASKNDVRGLSKAADRLETQRPLLAQNFRPIADQFAKDLRSVSTIYQKAFKKLTQMGEARETVKLFVPSGSDKPRTFKLDGKVPGAEGGVWYKGEKGINERLKFSELDDRDVLKLAELYETSDDGKKKLGLFYFWRGDPGHAYALLKPFKKDKSFGAYVIWMDLQARELISEIEDLYQQVTTMKLSSIEREKRRRKAEKCLNELTKGYSATEVYRERTQPK